MFKAIAEFSWKAIGPSKVVDGYNLVPTEELGQLEPIVVSKEDNGACNYFFFLTFLIVVSFTVAYSIHAYQDRSADIEAFNSEDYKLKKTNPFSIPTSFVRHPTTSALDCRRVMENDQNYTRSIAKQRITYKDSKTLAMSCESIRARNYFPTHSASNLEANYSLAQARIVYKDYRFLEMELAAAYAPQNWYCYAIDSKADASFHSRMHQLAKCLPNIILTIHEYKVDSSGHHMIDSFLECMKLLASKQWEYVSLLQNHDTAIRTNKEMVQIFRWLNGANDFEITTIPNGRVNYDLNWSFQALNLFKNATRNTLTVNGFPPKLMISKGYVESSLSRAMADFVLDELNLTTLLTREDRQGYGTDEIIFPTLNAADALQVPGGFTHLCLDRGKRTEHITRKSVWSLGECASHQMRHSICVFGVEDLAKTIAPLPHLFVNKFMPEFDFGAINCWYEAMFNRTYLDDLGAKKLNKAFYERLPHVRFQKFKADAARLRIPLDSTHLQTFSCSADSNTH